MASIYCLGFAPIKQLCVSWGPLNVHAVNINQCNCSLSDTTVNALFIWSYAATESHSDSGQERPCTSPELHTQPKPKHALFNGQLMNSWEVEYKQRKRGESRETDCQASGWDLIVASWVLHCRASLLVSGSFSPACITCVLTITYTMSSLTHDNTPQGWQWLNQNSSTYDR